MSNLSSLGDGNQGSIPTREPKKAAGVQITRSWHGEVATRNTDGVYRAGRHSWRRPALRQGGQDAYFRERDDDNFIDVKYMHHHRDFVAWRGAKKHAGFTTQVPGANVTCKWQQKQTRN